MRAAAHLAEFVRAGLAAGRGREELAGHLRDAGWSAAEIAAALDAWVPVPGLPPVPRPQAHVSAREALTYGLLFLLLGMIAWHLCALGFALIDAVVADPLDEGGRYVGGIPWSMATLIPVVPLFLWLNARVGRLTRADAGRRRSVVRKWFASVTLLMVAVALLGDLIAVLYAALAGELTLRFAAKAALLAVVGLLVAAWYRDELDAR